MANAPLSQTLNGLLSIHVAVNDQIVNTKLLITVPSPVHELFLYFFLWSVWPVFESEHRSKEASDGSAMVRLWLPMPQPFPGEKLFIWNVHNFCHYFLTLPSPLLYLKDKHRYSFMSSPMTGGNMLDSQSSFPWSSLQWCSWKTENIQVDHDAGQQLLVWQDVGQQAAGSLLQLQGT